MGTELAIHALDMEAAVEKHAEELTSVRTLLESTRARFKVAQFGRGAELFRQGDEADSVLHVERGRAWLAVCTAEGREAICGIAEPDSFLGEEVLAGHQARPHTATAMSETEVLVVPTAEMTHLLLTQPTLSFRFIAHTITREMRLETDLVDQLLSCSEERLAHTLLLLAGCDPLHPCSCKLPHVSQQVLAEMVGTTRSRVNLFMGRFKRAGFIRTHGGALHVNAHLLSRIQAHHREM